MSNNEGNPVLDGLMDRRTVVLSGAINHKSVVDVSSRLMVMQLASTDRINLIIDSGGGDLHPTLALCDLLTSVLTAPVRGIAIGGCASAATFVLLHCTERWGTPYSRYLIHSGTKGRISIRMNQQTPARLEALLKEVRAEEEMMITMYMKKLGKTRKVVQEFISRGDDEFNEYFSAEEAKKLGLITHIVDGKLDIFSKVNGTK